MSSSTPYPYVREMSPRPCLVWPRASPDRALDPRADDVCFDLDLDLIVPVHAPVYTHTTHTTHTSVHRIIHSGTMISCASNASLRSNARDSSPTKSNRAVICQATPKMVERMQQFALVGTASALLSLVCCRFDCRGRNGNRVGFSATPPPRSPRSL